MSFEHDNLRDSVRYRDAYVSAIDEVFRVIERDLQRKPREVFTVFSPQPIASASIAQVHRARLRSTEVRCEIPGSYFFQ